MSESPSCPKCESSYVYADGVLWVCPECAHEWSQNEEAVALEDDSVVKDANGQVLESGDNVIVVKGLKIKGSSQDLKPGTKIKNIRVIDPVDGHNIACKVPGIGALNLKSEFLRKA